jgi:hypothetical protein
MTMTTQKTLRFRPGVENLEDRCLPAIIIPKPPVGDNWFDQNLKDPAVRSLVRRLDADHNLSRQDMLAIFWTVSRNGVVNRNEFSDLKKIVANPARLGTPDYVEDLASKVVNGDPANAHYQGRNLGNLNAFSPGSQLDDLYSKWFLGTDHPQTSYAYEKAQGVLFGEGGPVLQDVRQGYVGDCYLMAALAETAERSPQLVKSMFIDNGDQTWTVRYYVNGKATYVTVDRYLPTYGAGWFIFTNMGHSVRNPNEVLWVALAEKAYAQMNESGVLNRKAANSYSAITAGYIADAIKQISGTPTKLGQKLDFNAVVSAWNAGKLIGFCSQFSSTPDKNIVPGHAYALVGYNADNKTFTVFNPWGVNNGQDPGLITLTWAQVEANFLYWDCTK